ncbi:MAG: hypothetical protein QM736_20515 [Vicinamibacterales bacterium]
MRTRVSSDHANMRVEYGGQLDLPGTDDGAVIAKLIADDLRDVLALPGHVVRVEEPTTEAAA